MSKSFAELKSRLIRRDAEFHQALDHLEVAEKSGKPEATRQATKRENSTGEKADAAYRAGGSKQSSRSPRGRKAKRREK